MRFVLPPTESNMKDLETDKCYLRRCLRDRFRVQDVGETYHPWDPHLLNSFRKEYSNRYRPRWPFSLLPRHPTAVVVIPEVRTRVRTHLLRETRDGDSTFISVEGVGTFYNPSSFSSTFNQETEPTVSSSTVFGHRPERHLSDILRPTLRSLDSGGSCHTTDKVFRQRRDRVGCRHIPERIEVLPVSTSERETRNGVWKLVSVSWKIRSPCVLRTRNRYKSGFGKGSCHPASHIRRLAVKDITEKKG